MRISSVAKVWQALLGAKPRPDTASSGPPELVMGRIADAMAAGRRVALIYLDIARFTELELVAGSDHARRVLHQVELALRQVIAEAAAPGTLMAIQNLWGDDFAAYLVLDQAPPTGHLDNVIGAVVANLSTLLRHSTPHLTSLRFHCAYSWLEGDRAHVGSLVYRAIRQAMQKAKHAEGMEADAARREFEGLLRAEQVHMVYQPVVRLVDGTVLGWEALARGPDGGRFESPADLFAYAAEVGMTWSVERVCRQRAIAGFGTAQRDRKLFVNVDPASLADPHFTPGQTMGLIEARGMNAQDVVFEITERTAIRDFVAFRRVLEHYRQQGFQVAVDDVGSGYSSLHAIAELRPDYMKVDRSLVAGIQNFAVKQATLESFVTLATRIGCHLVAEGIETAAELRTLIGLGVQYGQGYFLARPAQPPPAVTDPALVTIGRLKYVPVHRPSLHMPVAQLLETPPTVSPDTPVQVVAELLSKEPDTEGVVVVAGTRPVGLLMRDRLFLHLGARFGVPLYYDRPVSLLMNRSLATVDVHTPLEYAAGLLERRELGQRYEYLVVTDNGSYEGVLSVRSLVKVLTEAQLVGARRANPLTGLPGNLAIQDELQSRSRRPGASAVVYVDLNGFKSFNDTYGFRSGDQVLLTTARTISHVAARVGGADCFVGHVGGDDFVIILDRAAAVPLCQRIARLLERVARRPFGSEDAAEGPKRWCGRARRTPSRPAVTAAMAVVMLAGGNEADLEAMARRAARLKRQVKERPGCSYMLEPGLIPKDAVGPLKHTKH